MVIWELQGDELKGRGPLVRPFVLPCEYSGSYGFKFDTRPH